MDKKYFYKADDILSMSENLENDGYTDSTVLYKERDSRLKEALGLINGYTSFYLDGDFTEVAMSDFIKIIDNYHTTSIYDDSGNVVLGSYFTTLFKSYFRNYLTTEDFKSGLLSQSSLKNIKECCINCYQSYKNNFDDIKRHLKFLNKPKISAWLVALFGEQSDVVKYWTNKRDFTDSSSGFTAHISVLPHHIAGMSYFASANHGGYDWTNSYKGTSCQDTLRAGDCDTILHLPPNLKDTQMAIAYLTDSETEEGEGTVLDPIFQARAILRYIPLYDIILIQKVYGVGVAREYLEKAIKNKYSNAYTPQDINRIGGASGTSKYRFKYPQRMSVWSDTYDDEFFTYQEGLDFTFDEYYVNNNICHYMVYNFPKDFINYVKSQKAIKENTLITV